MGKKIIVAGGGHGGIAAASVLSKNGFDVTVYEKQKREDMGHDWTDVFDKKGFTAADMELPSPDKYTLKTDMTFYGPSMNTRLHQNTLADQLELTMERKEIYNHIISNAEENGVKFVYECEVKAPVMLGSRVAGLETADGVHYADLVIDAAGINSPVRSALPESLGIQNNIGEYERFYVYRAFFDRAAEVNYEDQFKVLLLHENKLGICWVASEEEYTDVLIGRFEPFDTDEANRTLEVLRKSNPAIGTKIVRGGYFTEIPVRQPLGVLVADGYAAVGDSAFMTVPIIGSGIACSLKAGRILADAVMADLDMDYSAASLWMYQKNYYDEIGRGLAPLALVKLMLTRLEEGELDYIFDNGILNAEDMTIGADSTSISAMLGGMGLDDLKAKAAGVIKNKAIFSKIARVGTEIARATAVLAAMPKEYDKQKVNKWVSSYNSCFRR